MRDRGPDGDQVARTNRATGTSVANRSGVDDRDSPVVATERWADALNKPGSVQVMVVNMLGLTGESATRPCRPMGRKGGLSRMGRGDAR